MVDVITSQEPTTLIALLLADTVLKGGDNAAWTAQHDELLAQYPGIPFPLSWSYANFLAAGAPPATPTQGSNSAAFSAWFASLS